MAEEEYESELSDKQNREIVSSQLSSWKDSIRCKSFFFLFIAFHFVYILFLHFNFLNRFFFRCEIDSERRWFVQQAASEALTNLTSLLSMNSEAWHEKRKVEKPPLLYAWHENRKVGKSPL
ncbi:hypothetical protein P8452_27350 [Trifolium repens]|nr:hypothetical protein P8452_27350 [Trifolium repens]